MRLRLDRSFFQHLSLELIMMATQPAVALKLIRFNDARSKKLPNRFSRHGYEIIAPLDRGGQIDPVAWKDHLVQYRVKSD
jgi:hypothetical protein